MPASNQMQQKVDRLTEKEKDCLRRWMNHQTAKQIAIDLGVSHHAIEKRLKLARMKLGVTTSIEAAQMLVQVEGYDRTASHSPDLHTIDSSAQDNRHRPLIIGAVLMTLTLAAILALNLQTVSADAYPAPTPAGDGSAVVMLDSDAIPHVEATPEAIRGFITSVFDRTDKDKSGFIETSEAPMTFPLNDGKDGKFLTGDAAQSAFIEDHDTDGDGKIAKAEFIEVSYPHYEKNGIPLIPANWVAHD